jgi:hypothetical protein
MKKKYIALIVIVAIIGGLSVLELTLGTVSALAFDQMDYKYSSHVIIPPVNYNGSAMGGFYEINGTGRDFSMLVVISGAEKTESPLDYTSDGLKIKGHIDTVKATPQTINYLWQKDLINAMFSTIFNGNMNMTCAAWNGVSNFQNDGQNFNGTFFINGVMTDWKGNYTLALNSEGRLTITSDYIYYPKNKPNAAIPLHSVYYL